MARQMGEVNMDRKTASRTLRRIGRLLEVVGENPHRVRAFAGAARAVETAPDDLREMVDSGAVLQLKGVGKGTAAVLEDLAAGRRPQALVEVEDRIPAGVREMLDLPGLGPKKARALWKELGLETLGELEYACRENRLLDLKGFGAATQTALLDGLAFHLRSRDRRLLHEAWSEGAVVREILASRPEVSTVRIVGELRRAAETVAELSYVVTMDSLSSVESVARSLGEAMALGDDEWLIRRKDGLGVRLLFVRPSTEGAALILATGDDKFEIALRQRAEQAGFALTREGLLNQKQGLPADSEAVVFDTLGVAFVPPELREGSRWLTRAVERTLPELVESGDIRGALHNHTTDSDGLATLEEMAQAAAALGWSFFGVADHSPAAFYANGVDAERLRKQWTRADAWNLANPGLRIVKGLEADILTDGRLDIPSGCEEGLDYVVASVHSSFRLSMAAQTDRLVTAVRHPACRVLGHPTGRLLLARPGYDVDLERVLDACAESGVAAEINASPYRLDLDWRWARWAIERGVKLIINPDAHSVDGLDDVRWGVAVARRAGATAADLVNCADIEEFLGG